MDEIQSQHFKSAIEALLFVSDKPVVIDQFRSVFPELKPSEITDLLKAVQNEYVDRNAGMAVVEIAGGWQMLSNSNAAGYIREFYKTKTKEKLSKAALESLAIIAYKQPTGRAEVEVIRGVNSDGTIAHLLNKGLIEIVGRKEVPGRPFLYGTTKSFLEYFGLSSLENLPKIEELTSLNLEAMVTETIQADANIEIEGLAKDQSFEANRVSEAKETTEENNELVGQESSGQSRVNDESTTTQTEN
jgi:segregation and condensation protein B